MYSATLPKPAQAALAILGESDILPKGTYLAGGSALALHIGHRISVDFDFFVSRSFNARAVIKRLAAASEFELVRSERGTVLGIFNTVKFSLFEYGYPLIAKTAQFQNINIAHRNDIAAMKLAALMDRGTKKDFVDVYFIVKRGISFEKLFQLYEKKYHLVANNLYSLIMSMSYFDDAEKTDMPNMLVKTSWLDVKNFMQKEAKRLARQYL